MLKTIAATIMSPTLRSQIVLKSGMAPVVSQKVIGCSSMFALTMSKRKAELKYYTMKVTVVVLDRRSVSVG